MLKSSSCILHGHSPVTLLRVQKVPSASLLKCQTYVLLLSKGKRLCRLELITGFEARKCLGFLIVKFICVVSSAFSNVWAVNKRKADPRVMSRHIQQEHIKGQSWFTCCKSVLVRFLLIFVKDIVFEYVFKKLWLKRFGENFRICHFHVAMIKGII